MSTRVYVPSSIPALRELLVSGGLGPAPVLAHAVTDEVRSTMPDAGEEEWEYAVLTAAAQASIGLLTDEDPPRRVVVVGEAASVRPAGTDVPGVVEVDEVIPLRSIVAVHADSEEAAPDVAVARDALPRAETGEEEAVQAVERCASHELGWFATQEIGDLVAE